MDWGHGGIDRGIGCERRARGRSVGRENGPLGAHVGWPRAIALGECVDIGFDDALGGRGSVVDG